MKRIDKNIDLRSLLIVLIAFVGNAEVSGMDIVFLILIPTLVAVQARMSWTIGRDKIFLLLALCTLYACAALRAVFVEIPYFDSYELWALKAMALGFLIALGPEIKWPPANIFILAIIVFFLVGIGQVQDGRLVSLFGPNMLYRIFGMLFLFSLMYMWKQRVGLRIIIGVIALFALYALILTGSSGAVLVALFSIGIFFLRAPNVYKWLSIVIAGLSTVIFWLGIIEYPGGSRPAFVARIYYKLWEIETNTRLVGWSNIFSEPFSLLGHSHSQFSHLWLFGYQYPHNIIVELYAFYGLLGLLFIALIISGALKASRSVLDGDILAMTFFILLIGSLFSGDLSDNYGVLGLSTALMLRARLNSAFSGLLRHTERSV